MQAEPKEWGFLFRDSLATAVYVGTKTATRRLVGPRLFSVDGGPWRKGWTFDLANARREEGPSPAGNVGPYLMAKRIGADTEHRLYPRVQVGDRIWAKETWRPRIAHSHGMDACDCADVVVRYEADGAEKFFSEWEIPDEWMMPGAAQRGNMPSILMPRWAARSVREVISVGLERLQDITEEEARREGIGSAQHHGPRFWLGPALPPGRERGGVADGLPPDRTLHASARDAFRALWDSINDEPGSRWADDPWVLPIGWRASAATSGRAA